VPNNWFTQEVAEVDVRTGEYNERESQKLVAKAVILSRSVVVLIAWHNVALYCVAMLYEVADSMHVIDYVTYQATVSVQLEDTSPNKALFQPQRNFLRSGKGAPLEGSNYFF